MNDADLARLVEKIKRSEELKIMFGMQTELKPTFERPSLEEIQEKVAELLWEHTSRDETPEGSEEISKYVDELLTAAISQERENAELAAQGGKAKPLVHQGYSVDEVQTWVGSGRNLKDLYRAASVPLIDEATHPHAGAREELFNPQAKRPPLPKSSPIHPSQAFKKV